VVEPHPSRKRRLVKKALRKGLGPVRIHEGRDGEKGKSLIRGQLRGVEENSWGLPGVSVEGREHV